MTFWPSLAEEDTADLSVVRIGLLYLEVFNCYPTGVGLFYYVLLFWPEPRLTLDWPRFLRTGDRLATLECTSFLIALIY